MLHFKKIPLFSYAYISTLFYLPHFTFVTVFPFGYYSADSVLSAYQGLMHNADVCYCRNHGICQALFLHRPGLRRFHISCGFPPQLTVFCLFYCPMPSGTVKAILRTADNSCEQSQMWVPQKNKN